MKRNVSVVCVCSAPNCCDTEQRSASQLGSVASGTHCMLCGGVAACLLVTCVLCVVQNLHDTQPLIKGAFVGE
jgi:hypothetical protein